MHSILVRGSFFRVLFMGLNFAAGLLLANLAGAGVFGTISLLVVNAAVFQIITGLGTDAALVWHSSGKHISPSVSFTFAMGSAILQLVLFVLLQGVFIRVTGTSMLSSSSGYSFFVPELLYFSGIVLTEKYSSLFYAHHKAATGNLILSVAAALFFLYLAGVFLSLIHFEDPVLVFCMYTFLQGVAGAAGYHLLLNRPSFSRISREALHSLFRFSLVVFITNLVQFLAYRADYWFISCFADKKAVGIFAQANRFAQLLWVLPNVYAALLIPLVKDEEKKFGMEEFLAYPRILNKLNIAAVIMIGAVSWFLYRYFFEPEFWPGWNTLLIMLPGYYFFALTLLLAAWFAARGQLRVNLAGSAICFGTIIIADILLIPEYTFTGAAIADSIAYIVTTIYFVIQFRKNTGLPFAAYFR